MTKFFLLARRISDLWQFLWEIEELLFLDKSKTPEEAAEKIITFYSRRNCGQYIHICVPCVEKFNELILDGARGEKTSKLYTQKEVDALVKAEYSAGYDDGQNSSQQNYDGHFIR